MTEQMEEKKAQAVDHELPEAPDQAPEQAEGFAEPERPSDAQKYEFLKDQYTRLAADFDNYRKRVTQEVEQARRYGTERAVMELLPVIDNLERAFAGLNENSDPRLLHQSFRLMHNQLTDGLANIGVKRIPAVGQEFDPNFHEAVSQIASAEHPENVIAAEMQSGYLLDERVLRPAMVSVSSGSPTGEAAENVGPETANPFRSAGQ